MSSHQTWKVLVGPSNWNSAQTQVWVGTSLVLSLSVQSPELPPSVPTPNALNWPPKRMTRRRAGAGPLGEREVAVGRQRVLEPDEHAAVKDVVRRRKRLRLLDVSEVRAAARGRLHVQRLRPARGVHVVDGDRRVARLGGLPEVAVETVLEALAQRKACCRSGSARRCRRRRCRRPQNRLFPTRRPRCPPARRHRRCPRRRSAHRRSLRYRRRSPRHRRRSPRAAAGRAAATAGVAAAGAAACPRAGAAAAGARIVAGRRASGERERCSERER